MLAWLSRHPRWTFHFTPTSASWLNAVENFFSRMTRQRIRRGVFRSIADLQTAINAYLTEYNASPKPFLWTKSAEAILAKLDRLPVTSLSQCTKVAPIGEVPGAHQRFSLGFSVPGVVSRQLCVHCPTHAVSGAIPPRDL